MLIERRRDEKKRPPLLSRVHLSLYNRKKKVKEDKAKTMELHLIIDISHISANYHK